jgi:hypothetical protein
MNAANAQLNPESVLRGRHMAKKTILLIGVILALAFGPAASACTVAAGAGDGVAISTWHPLLLGAGWLIGPTTVSADPDSGSWLKNLQSPGSLVGKTDTFYLLEILKVGSGPAWTDWHEAILTPGWDWGWGKMFTLGAQDALTAANPLSALNCWSLDSAIQSFLNPIAKGVVSDGKIDFFFDPLEPSTWVFVLKTIQWTGGDDASLCAPIRIAEHPSAVPIPAAVWLLGSGLVGLVALKRRRS